MYLYRRNGGEEFPNHGHFTFSNALLPGLWIEDMEKIEQQKSHTM